MTLSQLEPGTRALITKVSGEGALRRHLLDMGLTPNTEVFIRKVAPLGDPIELCLRGYELTLRLSEAELISVAPEIDVGFCSGSCSSCHSRFAHGKASSQVSENQQGKGFFGRGFGKGFGRGRGKGRNLFNKRGNS